MPSSGTTIAEALACGRPGCQCAATARRGSGLTHCPGHADGTPSLSVSDRGGKALVHCQAGCSQDAVIAALREKGLWPEAKAHNERETRPASGAQVRHELRDADGEVVAVHVRQRTADGDKRVWWEQPDGALGLNGRKPADLPLFGAETLAALDDGASVAVSEGEPPCEALQKRGIAAVGTVCGASVTPSDETLRALSRFDVRLWPDADPPGREHMSRIAARLLAFGLTPRMVEWRDAPEKGDAADFGGDDDELKTLIDAAPLWEPAPVPDGAALLDDLTLHVRKYVVLTADQASATALWVLHTYAIDAADATPYLHITSPEKRSGKTRLLEVLDLLAARPWFTGRVTAAVLQRRLERDHPSLLLDETDAAFKKESEYSEALRAILNAGHRRGCKAWLCVKKGGDIDLAGFDVFGPKALAGIGKLPETVADRSIRIVLRRRAPSEPVMRFRRREVEEEAQPIRERLERWAAAHLEALRDARPSIPDALDDRATDGWEPLLSIADAVGGGWPQRARSAALTLSAGEVRDDDSLRVRLLADIRSIFEEHDVDRLSSAELVAHLNAIEESPWGDYKNKPLDPRRLGWLLKPHGVKPTKTREGDSTSRHYQRWAFDDVWARYCISPEKPEQEEQPEREPDSDSLDVPVVPNVPVSTGVQERPSPLVQAALDMGATPLEDADVDDLDAVETRCHACGSTEFYFRPDGSGPVCARCHPNPTLLAGDRL